MAYFYGLATKKLFDLKGKKDLKTAVMLYLIFVAVTLLLTSLLGSFVGLFIGETIADQQKIGIDAYIWMSIIICVAVAFSILQKKNLDGNLNMIFVALSAGVLSYLGGAFLGFIPVAYLTTVTIQKH